MTWMDGGSGRAKAIVQQYRDKYSDANSVYRIIVSLRGGCNLSGRMYEKSTRSMPRGSVSIEALTISSFWEHGNTTNIIPDYLSRIILCLPQFFASERAHHT